MAAAKRRRPGSDRGRPACDWEHAFVYWAALPAQQRCYAAVATKFGVSARTVERHGRLERWQQRLQEINTRASAETDARLGSEKAEQIGRLRKLIEATLFRYAENLRRGDVRIGPADLDRLHKLWRQLDDELDAGIGAPAAQATPPPARSGEHVAAVVHALAESGALAQLGLQVSAQDEDHDDHNEGQESE
jgi:hypothetical protein